MVRVRNISKQRVCGVEPGQLGMLPDGIFATQVGAFFVPGDPPAPPAAPVLEETPQPVPEAPDSGPPVELGAIPDAPAPKRRKAW